MEPLVIGLDYGTDSARAVLVRVRDGTELRESTFAFPRWAVGKYCDSVKDQYRQHPLDYMEALNATVMGVLKPCTDEEKKCVVGIAVDTTGSTPCLVDETGTPLALQHERFVENPNAMFILWKDHTSVAEAAAINKAAHRNNSLIDYTKYSGGTYSSEWYWSKALHVINSDHEVAEAAYAMLECCEWIPAFLCGITHFNQIPRSRCACGHKAMWHSSWNGFPPASFWEMLHPKLAAMRNRMAQSSACTHTIDEPAGVLSRTWANKWGLSHHVIVANGGIDAHLGAVGAGIKPYSFVRVMGTSTCDMMVIPPVELSDKCVRGICGQVDGSIVPHFIGLEAGQSAYGDVFAWFARLLHHHVVSVLNDVHELDSQTRQRVSDVVKTNTLRVLSAQASEMVQLSSSPSSSQEETEQVNKQHTRTLHEPVALDWFNGRRTPDANQHLRATIQGLSLHTSAPALYRALVESTAFGSRAIVERFKEEGVRIDDVIAVGGIAHKSPLAIQILSDVLNMPIHVCSSTQVCARGAAIAAATAARCYLNIPQAQQAMASSIAVTYYPRPEYTQRYNTLYQRYLKLAEVTAPLYSRM